MQPDPRKVSLQEMLSYILFERGYMLSDEAAEIAKQATAIECGRVFSVECGAKEPHYVYVMEDGTRYYEVFNGPGFVISLVCGDTSSEPAESHVPQQAETSSGAPS